MQPDTFNVSMDDGVEIVIRHHPKPGADRLYISHGNGFAVDGYRVFWEPLLADFDVVLFDMRNHGRNDATGADGHHYQQMARDLTTVHEKVESRLGRSRAIGVFHSMTSRAAMKNAVDLGSPYDALVLYDPPSVPPQDHPLYEAMRGFELKLVQWACERPERFNSPDELEAAYTEARASSKWLPQARADMARAVLKQGGDGTYRLACVRELEASIYLAALTLDLWPSAEALGVPARLIGADPQGRGGPPTGPANCALAQEGGYDYVGMEGVGHLLQIEKPEECRQALTEFLSTI
ncbi:MAG: alpha/beta hydrolase [Rhodobiaceae bacterium]|nr:alpha/beta hydrolase [Rhodobiaceae bacterium]MCC0014554.1 alpha/beta hydrolase [Rhodobiaceae bacterium]MCC0052115.1 alpha/beta hydrolase [Rhodobiaceae bacterium]MCC0061365.1 alpha/beta hydrolase [Rhodobiaceae bacterium]